MHLTRAALICRATMRSSSCPILAVRAHGFAGRVGLVYDSVTACDTPTHSIWGYNRGYFPKVPEPRHVSFAVESQQGRGFPAGNRSDFRFSVCSIGIPRGEARPVQSVDSAGRGMALEKTRDDDRRSGERTLATVVRTVAGQAWLWRSGQPGHRGVAGSRLQGAAA